MYKIIFSITVFFIISVECVRATEDKYALADSITYNLYINGEWDKLIQTGNSFLKESVDFKYLRQRIGYAYFMNQNYVLSRWHYEKSLKFDKYDEITNLYLYLTGLYTGDEKYKRYYAGKLTDQLKTDYKISTFQPIQSAEVEYYYKTGSDVYSRSDSRYMRLGVNTEIGYRLSLYQTISRFDQIISAVNVIQTGYYALLTWNPTASMTVSGGYHYLNSQADDTASYKAQLYYGQLSYKKHIVDLSVNTSVYNNSTDSYLQTGFAVGIIIPQMKDLYLNSRITRLSNSTEGNWIFTQYAGFLPFRKLWIEGFVTSGKQQNYVELSGIYVYNSLDYNLFKAGTTLFYYLNKNITLYSNYTHYIKYLYNTDNTNQTYPQNSFSGGLIWKL